MPMYKRSGIYETVYGNACMYDEKSDEAFDVDMGEPIPLEMVNFEKRLRDGD